NPHLSTGTARLFPKKLPSFFQGGVDPRERRRGGPSLLKFFFISSNTHSKLSNTVLFSNLTTFIPRSSIFLVLIASFSSAVGFMWYCPSSSITSLSSAQ